MKNCGRDRSLCVCADHVCRGRRDNGSHLPDFHRLEHQRGRKKLREIDRLVSDKYVGELDADNVADYAAAGYITGLGDKWSSYIPAENYETYRMSGGGQGAAASAVRLDEHRDEYSRYARVR